LTTTDRWEPDTQLIASYLANARPEIKLSTSDRSWVVAGLTLAGKTAEDIAERLGCSLRLVRTIRADPMTQVCLFYQREVETFEAEMRIAISERKNAALLLEETQQELTRVKTQLGNLIANRRPLDKVGSFPRCGHPMDRYNTYEHGGKRFCRTCHREREKNRRASRSCQLVPTG
jgi:hypothetical protein